ADVRLLCSGPGRLCEALAITNAHNGLALDQPPFRLLARDSDVEIVSGPRIGITKAAELPWRYGLKGSRFLSKPFSEANGEKRIANRQKGQKPHSIPSPLSLFATPYSPLNDTR